MADFTTTDATLDSSPDPGDTPATTLTTVQALRVARDRIVANLLQETENPKPSYSIDGESVDWNTWAKTQQDRIDQLTATINKMAPYIIRTRQSL
jgi:hypothetical protein